VKTEDYAVLAGGAALVYFLWPKSKGAAPPSIVAAPGSSALQYGPPQPTAAAVAPRSVVETALDYATRLNQARAGMTPNELMQSILTDGTPSASDDSPAPAETSAPEVQEFLQGFGDFGYQCGTSILNACLPSDMRAAGLDLDQQIRSVSTDVDANRDKIPDGVASNWDAFVAEWNRFSQQDQGEGNGWLYDDSGTIFNSAWWAASAISMSALNSRLQSVIDWRARIRPYVGQLSSPDPTPPPPSSDPFAALLKALPWIAGGLAAIVVLPPMLRLLPAGKGK